MAKAKQTVKTTTVKVRRRKTDSATCVEAPVGSR